MHRKHIFRSFTAAMLLAAVGAFIASCDKTPEGSVEVSIKAISTTDKSGSQFVSVTASGDWTLEVTTDAEGDEVGWAWFNEWGSDENVVTLSGSGDNNTILLYWAKNLSENDRVCTLTLTSAGKTANCTFTQSRTTSKNSVADDIVSESVPAWMELPATDDADGMYFITHDMVIAGNLQRNYSFYWDKDALVAHWVAYPLNSGTISSGSRTNAWGLDPKVPVAYQPVLFSGFSWGYQRGHQCPSADRLASGANETTFYGTNMTPQKGELNEKAWAVLEGMVRDWSRSFDTLYVVTGCDLRGSTDVATDNSGKEVKVPSGYYKALLGYKKNGTVANTGRTGGYSGCAFYFEHRSYSNDRASVLGQSMSIENLEKKMDMDFFVNLPNAIGETNAKVAESTVDSFWK